MKTYTPENPPKSGNALKAWEYLTRTNRWFPNKPPKEMYFAKLYDCSLHDVWVGNWGYAFGPYDGYEDMDHYIFSKNLESSEDLPAWKPVGDHW